MRIRYILLLTFHAVVSAQSSGFQPYRFDNGADFVLPYLFFQPPDRTPGERYPLLIFFHGAGEWGNDNNRQLANFPQHFITGANSTRYPCYALAPQCTETDAWTSFPRYPEVYNPAEPTRSMAQVLALLDTLCKSDTLFIDTNRIYVTGQSLGGEAVFDIVTRAPHRFAAANPICGIADTAKVELMIDTPFWIFHGTEDKTTDVNYSRIIVDAFTNLGKPPRYTEYEGGEHNIWDRAYDEPELLPWLFEQDKSSTVRTGYRERTTAGKRAIVTAVTTNRKITLSWNGITPSEIGLFSLNGKCLVKTQIRHSNRTSVTIRLDGMSWSTGMHIVRLKCGSSIVAVIPVL